MTSEQARFRMVISCLETRSVSETARRWHTSRKVVRKWLRRFQAQGLSGLNDGSHRHDHSPRQTPPQIEQQVLGAWKKTHYGGHRLALYLRGHGLCLSPQTIRNILRRRRPPQKRKPRQPLCPALWAWDQEEPFSVIQTDVKYIHDSQAPRTERTTHLLRQRLPRYQWTACEARTRLRFLAYGHRLNRTNGMAFMILVIVWLRAHDVQTKVTFQTDWGQEFGGDNLSRITRLSTRYLHPLGADLRRYPFGRKGYNGRVERSHRTDDEEFYRPCLLSANDTSQLLSLALHGVYFHNTIRPHFGKGMDQKPPLEVLAGLGYNGAATIAALAPVLLDHISTDLVLACRTRSGNDLLARYNEDRPAQGISGAGECLRGRCRDGRPA